jgi:hypothetical protein
MALSLFAESSRHSFVAFIGWPSGWHPYGIVNNKVTFLGRQPRRTSILKMNVRCGTRNHRPYYYGYQCRCFYTRRGLISQARVPERRSEYLRDMVGRSALPRNRALADMMLVCAELTPCCPDPLRKGFVYLDRITRVLLFSTSLISRLNCFFGWLV